MTRLDYSMSADGDKQILANAPGCFGSPLIHKEDSPLCAACMFQERCTASVLIRSRLLADAIKGSTKTFEEMRADRWHKLAADLPHARAARRALEDAADHQPGRSHAFAPRPKTATIEEKRERDMQRKRAERGAEHHDTETAERIARQMVEDGETYRAIAAELTKRGIVTARGKANWTHTQVKRLVEGA